MLRLTAFLCLFITFAEAQHTAPKYWLVLRDKEQQSAPALRSNPYYSANSNSCRWTKPTCRYQRPI